MSIGLGGGKSKSSSETKQLTPEEMQAYYNQGLQNVGQFIPDGDSYEAPTQQTLTGGDYTKLQDDTLKGYTLGLDYAKDKDLTNFNNSAGAKGIWSSGLALQGEQDIAEGYNPAYASAGAQATQAALTAKQAELSEGNRMALTSAQAEEAAKWKKADYLGNLWSTSKGSNSKSSGSSWNASASGSMPA